MFNIRSLIKVLSILPIVGVGRIAQASIKEDNERFNIGDTVFFLRYKLIKGVWEHKIAETTIKMRRD